MVYPTPEEGGIEEGQPQQPSANGDALAQEQKVLELEAILAEKDRRLAENEQGVQKLLDRNKLLQAQVEKMTSTESPSEKELAETISDWDILSPTEKKLLKDTISIQRDMAKIKGNLDKAVDKLNWEDAFSDTIKTFPNLAGKKQDFREFCYRPENLHSPMIVLARAFCYDDAKEVGAKEEKEKLSRPGLETGKGGLKEPPKPGITLEEVVRLRTTNPKLYAKMLQKGELKDIPEK